MKQAKRLICLILSALMLSGCSIQAVNQMYQLPKRSEDYSNLQSVMDQAMAGLDFCAPITGDNQQSVQLADVDGDEEPEYMVFSKANEQLPLRVLVFDRQEDTFVHVDTIESNGAAFDQVEYVQMDDKPGLELVIGRQISDQLVRSVSVYTFAGGEAEQLMTANYRKYVVVDVDDDGYTELFVLRPGETETDRGVAEVYGIQSGVMERSNEMTISAPVDKLKRVLVGKLQDKRTAVYVASSADDIALITDIFTQTNNWLINVSLSGESGTSSQTARNYYVYADDMDNDGVVELPRLLSMVPMENTSAAAHRDMIAWYSMASDGSVNNKLYTYYDSVAGWYMVLDNKIAPMVTVHCSGNVFDFYLWNENYAGVQKLMSVYILTGQNRDEQGYTDGRFVLLRTDTVTYAARLDTSAGDHGITPESARRNFYLVHSDWNTGEM